MPTSHAFSRLTALFFITALGCAACSDSDSDGTKGPDLCESWDIQDPGAGESSIQEYFARFQMPVERDGCTTLHRPHSENRWNVFYTGRCAGCGIPNHMGAASFGDTVIVSWVASAAYQDSEEPNKRKFGHLSTFTFTEDDGFTQVSDFVFDACDHDMGEVAMRVRLRGSA